MTENAKNDAPKASDAASTTDPERRAVEAWAELKGHIKPGWNPLNRYISVSARSFVPQDFNVAKCLHAWGDGRETTEAEYDAAIQDAACVTAG